jgi:multiple sugar transport system permease protein
MTTFSWLKWGSIVFFLIPMLLILLFPFTVMISTSFKTLPEVSQIPPTFIPQQPTLQNYRDVWSIIPLAKHFRNSFLLGLGEILLVMTLGLPAAYALARFRFAGRQPYMIFLLITQMFPPVLIILGLFRLVAAYGLVNNLLIVIIIAAAFNLAFCIWLLTGYFMAIPPEIEEAAMMDGNSRLGAMLRMTVPLSWPGLTAVAIFAFMDGWNDFLFSLTLLKSDEFLPLTVGLYHFIARFQIQWNYLMAGSFLTTIIVVALFILIQKNLTRGLVAVSEK